MTNFQTIKSIYIHIHLLKILITIILFFTYALYDSEKETICRPGKQDEILDLYRIDTDEETDLIGWIRCLNGTLLKCQNCIDYLYDLEAGRDTTSKSGPIGGKPKRVEKKIVKNN